MPRYDAGGRLKEKWLPNGVNSRYAYNTDNTLTQMVNRSLTTTIISQHDCLYDVYANRRQQISNITGSALTHAYAFDALIWVFLRYAARAPRAYLEVIRASLPRLEAYG